MMLEPSVYHLKERLARCLGRNRLDTPHPCLLVHNSGKARRLVRGLVSVGQLGRFEEAVMNRKGDGVRIVARET